VVFIAKIGERNKKRRSIQQMAKDIAFILNCEELSYAAKHDVIHGVTWQWTQRDGLHRGNKIWSSEAIEDYQIHHTKTKQGDLGKYYREEHIVPRKIIIDYLLNLQTPVSWSIIFEYLQKYLKSIVLTLIENKEINRLYKSSMPSHIDLKSDFDEWARYRHSSIIVKSITWRKSGNSLCVGKIEDYFE
jgi:hypothetical protein